MRKKDSTSTFVSTLKTSTIAAICMVALQFSTSTADAKKALTEDTRMQLQISLMQYIDARTYNGQFMYFDASRGELTGYYPANLHPKIVPFDDHYVLCADFRRADGTKVEIDFLALGTESGGQIVQTLVDQREAVMKVVKSR